MKPLDIATEKKIEPRLVSWPSPQDYNEAIQNPHHAFADSQLSSAEAELNVIGLPKPASGNFASVYRMFSDQGEWAVRCFLQPMSDQQERYAALSDKLANVHLPYLVGFEFLPEGIRVHNDWFPMIKMQWVLGHSLLEYVQANLKDAETLHKLADSFRDMVISLRDSGIAHGDLQHGNIMVEDHGQLRLVDYDGCFVPALEGRSSNELGHRNYQHPKRDSSNFDEHIDTFSARLIWLSLKAIADDPLLWDKLQAGDECLLFRRQDLVAPEYSRSFHLLELHHNEDIRQQARALRSALKQDPQNLVPFDQEASIASDLPPLSAVMEIKTAPTGIHYNSGTGPNGSGRSRPRSWLERYPKEWTNLITGVIVMSIAWVFVSVSQWAASSVSHGFNVSWPQDSMDRAKKVKEINDMMNASEYGDIGKQEAKIDARNMASQEYYLPRRLLQQAEISRYTDKHRAELNFKHAIELSGEAGFCTLNKEELANALEFVGLQKSERNEGDYGIPYLENSYRLFRSMGNQYQRRASFIQNELADAALKAGFFIKAYESYLNCLSDYQYSSKSSAHTLTHYAAEAALKIFSTDDGHVKSTSHLRTLWNVIRRYEDPEILKVELGEIYNSADQLLSDKKFADAATLFSLQKELASQRGDLDEFEKIAAKHLEDIVRLEKADAKRHEQLQQAREQVNDGEQDRAQSPPQNGRQYLTDAAPEDKWAQKARLPRPEATTK